MIGNHTLKMGFLYHRKRYQAWLIFYEWIILFAYKCPSGIEFLKRIALLRGLSHHRHRVPGSCLYTWLQWEILVWLRGTESSLPTSLAIAPHNLARPGFPSSGVCSLSLGSVKIDDSCYNRDFHFVFLFQNNVWRKSFYRAIQSIEAHYVHTAVKINGEKRSSWTCRLTRTTAWEQKDEGSQAAKWGWSTEKGFASVAFKYFKLWVK